MSEYRKQQNPMR